MATRSFIITTNPKGDCSGIYCHWDGYPSWVGRILSEHYTTPGKVRQLIRLGDLSSLHERITPTGPHSFDTEETGVTVAYWRDRYAHGHQYDNQPKWANLRARRGSLSELVKLANENWCEYVYLYFNGLWHYASIEDALDNKPFDLLAPERIEAELQARS